jgi:hypothetical protein
MTDSKQGGEMDDYSRHEALDRASIFCNMLSDQLLDHHFIQEHPRFRGKVEAAIRLLAGLYQEIGAEHFSEPVSPSPEGLT